MTDLQHGDKVTFELYTGRWVSGTVYAVLPDGTVVVQGDYSPPTLYEKAPEQVKVSNAA